MTDRNFLFIANQSKGFQGRGNKNKADRSALWIDNRAMVPLNSEKRSSCRTSCNREAKLNRRVWRLFEERIVKEYAMSFEEHLSSDFHKSF